MWRRFFTVALTFLGSLPTRNGPSSASFTALANGFLCRSAQALSYPSIFANNIPKMKNIAYADDPKSYADVAPKSAKLPAGFSMVVTIQFPVDGSRKLNEAIKAAGGNVCDTKYPGVGHNSRDNAYADPELMKPRCSRDHSSHLRPQLS